MKKRRVLLWSILLCLVGGLVSTVYAATMRMAETNANDAEITWQLTNLSDLATGDVVVIVDQTSSTAMSNNNGTSSAPSAVGVTLSNDKSKISSDVEAKIQWTVTKTETGYQFGVDNDFVYCTNSNNGIRVGSNKNNVYTWKEADANSNANFLYNVATSRYVGVYNNSDWRCYTTVNANIKETVTAFYKKVVGGEDPTNKTIYLKPGVWNADGARYAVYAFTKDTNDNQWYDFTAVEGTQYYSATVPTSWSHIILCRMKGDATENNWDNKWNQTADIDFGEVANNALFKITGWGEDKSPYAISAYPEVVAKPTFSPAAGTYAGPTVITLSCEEGATICYTTDGTEPTHNNPYSGPFTITETTTVKAIAIADDIVSATAEATYTIIESIANPKEQPYSVTQALDLIAQYQSNPEVLSNNDNKVYVKGAIKSITEVNLQYGNATYTIADEAGNELLIFRGNYLDNELFTSADQLAVGQIVNVYGNLKNYVKDEVSTPEMVSSYLVSVEAAPVVISSMSIVGDLTGGWPTKNEESGVWDFSMAKTMTQSTENPAIWTLTIEGFEAEGKTYKYKATANGKYGDYELPASGDYEFTFGTEGYPAGKYNLTFTANTSEHNVTLAVTKVEPVTPVIPDGTYYLMNAEAGTFVNAAGALDAKGAPITFTFNATNNTYTIEGADFFAGKQWTIANAIEGISGYYTISTADGFLAANSTALEQIADGTADEAVWVLLQKAYWEDIVNSTYTVAGTKDLTGTENDWDIVETNQMTYNEETKLFEKTYNNITVSNDVKPEFKVVKENMEGEKTWYPASDNSGDHNWVINTDVTKGEGVFTITITFDPSDSKEIGVACTKTGEVPVEGKEDDVKTAPEGWTLAVTNGNLAGDDVSSYFAKEAPAEGVSPATIVAGAGKSGGRGIVVKSADRTYNEEEQKWNGTDWDTQFWIKLNEALPVDAKLHVEFDYKASQEATTYTQAHGEPGAYHYWACIGDVKFTTEWQHFSKDITVTADMAGADGLLSIAFNMAVQVSATEYYLDNFAVWYQMPKVITDWADLIVNGDMEGESAECFYVTEQGVGGPYLAKFTEGIGKGGSKAVKVESYYDPTNDWDSQFFVRLPYQLPAGTKYRVSFDYKATKAGDFDTQCHAEPGQYIHYTCIGSGSFTTEWQTYSAEGTVPAECDGSQGNGFLKIFQTIAFNLGKNKTATQFIFDNVKFEVDADIVASLTKNPAQDVTPYPEEITKMAIVGELTGGWPVQDEVTKEWDWSMGKAMTQSTEDPAVWTLTVENFVAEGKAYYYRAAANDNWERYVLPYDIDGEFIFGTEGYPAGVYNLNFTVNTKTHKLTLEPERVLELGDPNGDGDVTTSDAVLTVSFALEKETPTESQFKAADVNKNNILTVSDAVGIVNIALGKTNGDAAAGARLFEDGNNFLTLNGKTLSLTNSTAFAGFQMDVTLAEGAQFNGAQLSQRAAGMELSYNRIGENTWRIIAISLDGNTISGGEGDLLTLDIMGNSTVSVSNIEFADGEANAYALGFGGATGINSVYGVSADSDIYNLNGVRTNTMHKGMNIIRNANGEVKKVFVK